MNRWPTEPEELGRITVLTTVSHFAEWVLALAPMVFIGRFPIANQARTFPS
jgi:hypothetical protein